MDIGEIIEIGEVKPQEFPLPSIPERVPEYVPAEPAPELVPA